MQVYGVPKVWKQMNREGILVARCTVGRLSCCPKPRPSSPA
ncbi:IS3 family transposase [Cupriavidus pinatubonensis]|nr:IS3 family transposase [Cupriavidus pinatubonensis]